MQHGATRRTERVLYRGPVELFSPEAADGPQSSVRAETVDLGRGGMRIEADVAMPVGAAVTCKLLLNGRETSLAGRVAWAARVADQHGIGICFEALSRKESALLQHMVERARAGYRAVELRFVDLPQPIWARARRRTKGLQLSAALPILARGSELSFRLDAEGPLLIGRVADAALREDDSSRRIEVDVDVVERESGVRFRRNARYGFPSELDTVPLQVATAAPERGSPATAPLAPTVEVPAVRGPNLGAVLLSALLGATAGVSAAGWQRPASARAPYPRAVAAAPDTVALQALDTPTPAAPPALPTPEQVISTALPAEPTPLLAPHAQAEPTLKPDVHGNALRTRIRVPFEGTLELMHALQWAAPPALTLYFPAGRVPLAERVFRARTAGISSTALSRKDGEQLLRVKLNAKLTHYTVNLDSGALELTLFHE